MISIRSYCVDDTQAMIDLFRRSIHEVACAFYKPEQLAVWAPDDIDAAGWTQRCLSRPTWLALIEGQLAGFTDLEGAGHIDLLYVHPDFQRRGVAHALYRKALEQAKQNQAHEMTVEASLAARGFFELQGFKVDQEQIVERAGQQLVNFKMSKLL